MTSIVTIKREVEKIKLKVHPKGRTALIWDNGDDTFTCDGYNFNDKKNLQQYLDEAGYSKATYIGWQR